MTISDRGPKRVTVDDVDMPKGHTTRCPKCGDKGRVQPPKINDDYEVDEIAGYNENITDLYIDRRVPKLVENVDTRKSLPVHELVEAVLELWLGFGYDHAHEIATAAENRFVELCGGDPDKYEAAFDKIIKKLEHTAKDTPPDVWNPNKIRGR